MKRRSQQGFTLIEVMMALAIISLVSLVLISRRTEIVQDAIEIRDKRMGWMLAGWKMGHLSLDPILFQSTGRSESGNFDDMSTEYGDFSWEYEAYPEDVQLDANPAVANDPAAFKKIFRVKLKVFGVQKRELYALEAQFPVQQAAVAAPAEPAPTPENP